MTIEYFRSDNRPTKVSPLEAKLNEIIDAINSGNLGSSAYVPGTDRIAVTITNLSVSVGTQAIDWSHGTPTVYSQGTALTTSATNIVFAEDGLYDVQVHLPSGVDDGAGSPVSISARLNLTATGTQADGDTDAHAAGLSLDDASLSAHYLWVAEANDVVDANLVCSGSGRAQIVVCQVVRISDLAGGDP